MQTHSVSLADGSFVTPMDIERSLRFDVYRRHRRIASEQYYTVNLAGFSELEDAVAAIGNNEIYLGRDLWVVESSTSTVGTKPLSSPPSGMKTMAVT